MDKCDKCNCSLSIAKSHITFEGDESPILDTIAYNVLDMVCTNPKCDNYTENLNNPKIIIDTLRQRMN